MTLAALQAKAARWAARVADSGAALPAPARPAPERPPELTPIAAQIRPTTTRATTHFGAPGDLAACMKAWLGDGGAPGTLDPALVTCELCLRKFPSPVETPAPAPKPPEPARRLPLLSATESAAFVVYRGPSAFDDSPILGIVTGTTGKTKNAKTGPMAQFWILPAGAPPHVAQASGADASVCGDCALRPSMAPDGAPRCYVAAIKAPQATWLANADAPVRLEECVAVLREHGTSIRLGAYGDPAALPRAVVEALAAAAPSFTGYTHDWRAPRSAWLKPYAMASVEAPQDQARAVREGWRTFRILAASPSPLEMNEVLCPWTTSRTTCLDCRLCDGAKSGDARKSVGIVDHGEGRRKPLVERSAKPPREPPPERTEKSDPEKKSVPAQRRKLSFRTMTREEELELIQRYQAGDNGAGVSLMEAHEGMIVKWARYYARRGVDLEDVLQEGRMGFLRAVKEYDPAHGAKLSTFAVNKIRGAGVRYVENFRSTVRIPVHIHHGGGSEALRESASRVSHLRSLDAPIGDDDGATLGDLYIADVVGPDEFVTETEAEQRRKDIVREALERAGLTLRQRQTIERRHLADEPETLEEISTRFGVSREMIRQYEKKGLAKLRRALRRPGGIADAEDAALWERGVVRNIQPETTRPDGTMNQAVLDYLAAHPAGSTGMDMAKAFGQRPRALHSAIVSLSGNGRIRKIGSVPNTRRFGIGKLTVWGLVEVTAETEAEP